MVFNVVDMVLETKVIGSVGSLFLAIFLNEEPAKVKQLSMSFTSLSKLPH